MAVVFDTKTVRRMDIVAQQRGDLNCELCTRAQHVSLVHLWRLWRKRASLLPDLIAERLTVREPVKALIM
eukprot:2690702-Amphidinium_carterae.1